MLGKVRLLEGSPEAPDEVPETRLLPSLPLLFFRRQHDAGQETLSEPPSASTVSAGAGRRKISGGSAKSNHLQAILQAAVASGQAGRQLPSDSRCHDEFGVTGTTTRLQLCSRQKWQKCVYAAGFLPGQHRGEGGPHGSNMRGRDLGTQLTVVLSSSAEWPPKRRCASLTPVAGTRPVRDVMALKRETESKKVVCFLAA